MQVCLLLSAATSIKLGKARADSRKILSAPTPCFCGGTLRNIELCEGSVTLGMTVRAVHVYAPLCHSRSMFGVLACCSASFDKIVTVD